MTQHLAPRLLAALSTALISPLALAHEGHGMDAFSHWHSTDAWGFVVMAVLGLAMWWGRRK